MRRVALVWLLLWTGVALAGESRVNLWPLFFYARSPGVERLEALGPLFYRYRNGRESSVSLRPLVSWVNRRDSGERDLYFLSPLGHYHAEGTWRHLRLVPLFSYDWETGEKESTPASSHTYFPVFWGRTAEGEGYWGVFPIYGTMRDRFGYDEIRFVLWPLYSRATVDGDRSTNILWPIFNYSRGPTLSGFKIWPLWGFREKRGEYRRSFFLWPVFIWETRYAEGRPTLEKRMVWPLYVREETPTYRRRIYLWPFFQHVRGRDGHFEQWDFPWPFVQIQRGEDRRGFRLWPLFGFREAPDHRSNFVLWPLFSGEELRRGPEEEVAGRFLLLSSYRRIVRHGRERERFLRVWPLFVHWRRTVSGESLFYFPALLPFYDEGLERNLGPLLRLFEVYRFADGRRYVRLLWGLYRYETGAGESVQELAFLLSYQRTPRGRALEILDGLFGIYRTDSGTGLRLLWFIRLGPSV